ncbi:MAG: glycoside hydrolase family 2 TIM barrel-domain containing protein [Bacteroidales bacterium]
MRITGLNFHGMIITIVLIIFNVSCSDSTDDKVRIELNFNSAWRFNLGDGPFSGLSVNDSNWRVLDLPHDWSIEGEFSKDHPATVGGGALPGGIGWYRKSFFIDTADSVKNHSIHFGGIYRNSEVYLNGHLLGIRPNGYISFSYDMTPYLNYGDEENIIAVKVDNSRQPNSRWYSGSGIYRRVHLVSTSKIHCTTWGTYITTPVVEKERATVTVETVIQNSTIKNAEVRVRMQLFSPGYKLVAEGDGAYDVAAGSTTPAQMAFELREPERWSTLEPDLYTLRITLYHSGNRTDETETRFGIRKFRFDHETGFYLNDQPLKIRGVCNHHDLGSLGAAVHPRALERQLELLKEMGCNAIRTAHNPPATELLELCDQMGFLVMDETFDMWKKRKSPYDYSLYWDEWHERDLRDHILRDRNHPSVFLWSIGNEILEQWDSTGTYITSELVSIVRSLDSTREIVTGNNWPHPDNALLKAGEMDVIGYNYQHKDFEKFPERFPGNFFIATETTSGLMTRGSYDMPSDSIRRWPVRWDIPFNQGNADHSVSSYDNVSTPWGSTHEESWSLIKKHPYLSGMFIWTGFDYLGEPTPYGWPSRSSYFGIIDLAGFPKDVYHMYKSEWTEEPVLHLFPHWNWTEGEEIDVMAYTNCSSVELFLNDKSMGVRENSDTVFHLKWRLKFEPGELRVVGILPSGEEMVATVTTAGEPAKLEVIADRSQLNNDAEDLSFITINILDEHGTVVPRSDNLVTCVVKGDARVIATDNGNPVSHEPFVANERKAFNGKCLFVLQPSGKRGSAEIFFRAEGLEGESVILNIN